MSRAPASLAVVLALAAVGFSAGVEPDGDDVPFTGIVIDRPRGEGHPCRAEAIAKGTLPPGAIPYVVDVCVHRSVAGIFAEDRPRSLRPAYEP